MQLNRTKNKLRKQVSQRQHYPAVLCSNILFYAQWRDRSKEKIKQLTVQKCQDFADKHALLDNNTHFILQRELLPMQNP